MKSRIHKKSNMNKVKVIMALSFVPLMTLNLSARAEDPDYGNDLSSAEPIDPNGMDIYGTINPTGDEDWFRFPSQPCGVYQISFSNSSGGYKYIYVYHFDPWNQLQEVYHTGTSGSIVWTLFLPKGDTYYLQVYYSTGNYRFSVDELGTYPPDSFSDTCIVPEELVVDADPTDGTISDNGVDRDWFTVNTLPLRKYEITLINATNTNARFDFYDANCGDKYIVNRTGLTFVSWYGDSYDVRVHSPDSYEDYYRISVEDLGQYTDDYGNTYDVATPITTDGTEVFAAIEYDADLFGDEDWFSFDSSAYGLYEMSFRNSSGGHKYIYVYRLNEWGELDQVYNTGSSGSILWTLFLPKADTYYVQVYYNSGNYRFSVDELDTYPPDNLPDTCIDPEELVVDADPTVGTISDNGADKDWFSLNTLPLHKYEITLINVANTNARFDFYKGDCGDQYISNRTGLTFVSWYGDSYDVKVYSPDQYEDYYEILVTDVAEHTDDYGNTYEVATPINTDGNDILGHIEYAADLFSDEDWFTFTATVDGTYDIYLASQWKHRYLTLYKLNKYGLLEQVHSGGTSGEALWKLDLNQGVAYYIKIYNDTGYYTFRVLSPEPRCGDLDHAYPPGDANQDCVVNFVDLAVLADNWLADNRP